VNVRAEREETVWTAKSDALCPARPERSAQKSSTIASMNGTAITPVKQNQTWHSTRTQSKPWYSTQTSTLVAQYSAKVTAHYSSTHAHGTILTARTEIVRTRVAKAAAVWSEMLSTSRNLSHRSKGRTCCVNVGMWHEDVGPAPSRHWAGRFSSNPQCTPGHHVHGGLGAVDNDNLADSSSSGPIFE
jgi:hypothetical protein